MEEWIALHHELNFYEKNTIYLKRIWWENRRFTRFDLSYWKKNSISNFARRAICKEFEINEKWLIDGEGEMYSDKRHNKDLELFIESIKDERVKKLILRIATLNDKGLEMVSNVVDLLANDEILMEIKKQKKE